MMGKLDLLLIIPGQPNTAKFLALSSGITQPLGSAYIAGYLLKRGFSVHIHDNDIFKWPEHKLCAMIKSLDPMCVGISTFTNSFFNALSLSTLIKKLNPFIKIILGGPHASALPDYALNHESVDIVVVGEGEETTSELLNALKTNGNLYDIPGIVFKNNGVIVHNALRKQFLNIDDLPIPAYHLLPMNKYYLPASRRMGRGHIGTIITGRGCPYRCTFCSRAVFGNQIRLKHPKTVVDEIKLLYNDYSVRELLIWDDVFTFDENRAIDICERLTYEKIKIVWSCSSRADRISERLFSILAKAGCRELLIGAESGSQKVLNALKKDISLSQIEDSVKLCKKYKIRSFCTFMIGSPFETKDSLNETLKFLKKLSPDFALFCLLAPLPGSVLFDEISRTQNKHPNDLNWNDFISVLSASPPPFQIGELSSKELVHWQKKLFREFYLTVPYMTRYILKMRAPGHIYEAIRGFLALIGHQHHKF